MGKKRGGEDWFGVRVLSCFKALLLSESRAVEVRLLSGGGVDGRGALFIVIAWRFCIFGFIFKSLRVI